MPAVPSIAACHGKRSRNAQTKSAKHTSSAVPAAISTPPTRTASPARALALKPASPIGSDRTLLIGLRPPLVVVLLQYSTGTGSSERHRYQVATERHGRQRSPILRMGEIGDVLGLAV